MSVRPNDMTRLPRYRMSWKWIFKNVLKICQENWSFIKIWR